MILRILKDLRTGSRHTRQKEFCWALEKVMKAVVTGVTRFSRKRLVEYVISQRPHVSALVRSTSNASRLERSEIVVGRSHLSDKIMTTTRAQQQQGFVPKVSLSDGVRDTIAWHTERGEL
jgi:nucleoside-diphosphate-sugar epimerase